MCKNDIMKKSIKIKLIIGIILLVIGFAGIIYSIVMQGILQYQKFGVLIGGSTEIFIPHISNLGFIGAIPAGIGASLISFGK